MILKFILKQERTKRTNDFEKSKKYSINIIIIFQPYSNIKAYAILYISRISSNKFLIGQFLHIHTYVFL